MVIETDYSILHQQNPYFCWKASVLEFKVWAQNDVVRHILTWQMSTRALMISEEFCGFRFGPQYVFGLQASLEDRTCQAG